MGVDHYAVFGFGVCMCHSDWNKCGNYDWWERALDAIRRETGVEIEMCSDAHEGYTGIYFVIEELSSRCGERTSWYQKASFDTDEKDTLHLEVSDLHRRAIALFQEQTGLQKPWQWSMFTYSS